MNYDFVSQFAFWLKSVRKCGHNATMKYIGNLKKIVLECIKKGWLVKDPFAGFKTNKKEVIRVALTKDELSKIEIKEFDTDRLNHVRDIFLFSCYTGLAYVDVYQLRRSDIVEGWKIMALGFIGDKTGNYEIKEMESAIKKYDKYWKQFKELKNTEPQSATLYQPYAFVFKAPDYHLKQGMGASVGKYRVVVNRNK